MKIFSCQQICRNLTSYCVCLFVVSICQIQRQIAMTSYLCFSLKVIFFSRVKSGRCRSTHASCWKEHVEQWGRHGHTIQIQTAAKHTYHNSNLCYRYVHISIWSSSWHGPAALALCSIQHLSILKECLWWASLTCIVCGREFRPSEPGLGPHQHTKHRRGCCCD